MGNNFAKPAFGVVLSRITYKLQDSIKVHTKSGVILTTEHATTTYSQTTNNFGIINYTLSLDQYNCFDFIICLALM